MNLNELQEVAGKWERKVEQHQNFLAFAEHLREEANEVEEAYYKGEDIAEQLADIVIISAMAANYIGQPGMLEEAVKEKLARVLQSTGYEELDDRGIRRRDKTKE